MKHTARMPAAIAAVIIALTASGCKAEQDIDLSLIGGEMNSENISYTVDIVAADEPTAEAQSDAAPAPETEEVPEPTLDTPVPTSAPEPVEIETDENGFPANPKNNDTFIAADGKKYIYNSIFQHWGEVLNDGKTIVEEFPSFEVEDGDEIILH